MSEFAIVGTLLVGGTIAGILLSRMFYSESRVLESAFRIPFNITWMLVGGFMILGGYYAGGAIVLIIGTYFAASNARRIHNSDVTSSPGGWRKRAANWNPGNRSN